MLLGARAPVHVLTPSATVRRILNMTALVAASAAAAAGGVPARPVPIEHDSPLGAANAA